MELTWDEAKRRSNLVKHGLDFADAALVLDSSIRMDAEVERGNELRRVHMAYVFGRLATLLLVVTDRDDTTRIISFRRANREEREIYHDWLASEIK
jgi:uncharacterized DUF497 family protein